MEINLNIIPEGRKKEIMRSNKLRHIFEWEIGLSIVFLVFFLLLMSMYYLLTLNLIAQKGELASGKGKEEFEKIAKFNNDFKAANKQITTNESIQKDQLYWSKLFNKLSEVVLDEVSVTKIATKNYHILLAGTAKNRDDLIKLKDKFSQEGCFTDTNLPLSSLISKENVNFQIEFNIKEECVKNK